MAAHSGVPHFPQPAPIEGYGKGGFRFAGMSHRGSLLCLPDGIWAWDIARAVDITAESLARVFDQADALQLFFIGTGDRSEAIDASLRERFRDLGISLEVTKTSSAANTYNILLGEGRRVGAALIAAT